MKEIFSSPQEVAGSLSEISASTLESHFFREGDKVSDIPIGTRENPRYIINRNEYLLDDRHPITGVTFIKETVELPSGEFVEGVFPKFESKFSAFIPRELFLESDKKQFKECNIKLYEAIQNDPNLKTHFNDRQIEQIKDGISNGAAPDGYVWHHEPETGKLSLVDSYVHAITGHTGGRSLWGGGKEYR